MNTSLSECHKQIRIRGVKNLHIICCVCSLKLHVTNLPATVQYIIQIKHGCQSDPVKYSGIFLKLNSEEL